ncbi:RuBisCO operon transcriptional regulator [Candidatus Hydrogenisulfobacillus filiaventi]|uniref:RuBisCO operon transcriptional regulator n=1 Tax=Candidatus Hydrogenisulfobacillus filiaventi TaxID=2707344 RepID=A0A6F8ZDT3_9FIRM|nr:RuBisCO operon transcriptional regulator [Candidatus Hydrogenisulfobacillus filiaventi]
MARHMSFSRAAEDMILSQPAVSMHIKHLERVIGLPLFEKVGRRIRLTEAGERLYHYSQRLFALLQETAEAMDALRGAEQGHLRVAADTTAGVYVVPAYLGRFRRAHPQVMVALEVTNRESALERLLLREVDLAVIGQLPSQEEELEATPFLVNELVVIASPDHRLAGRTHIPVQELEAETLLMREPGSGTRATTERFFAEAGVQIRSGMELGSNSTIKQAVAHGLGIAVMSRRAIDLEVASGRLVVLDVEGFPRLRYWHVAQVRDRFLPPPAAAFKALLLAGARGPETPAAF